MNNTKSILRMGKEILQFIRSVILDAIGIISSPVEGFRQIKGVSFFRNAGYLIVNSGISMALGFVFWIIVARFYDVAEVGYGSTLLSVMGFLAYFGTLGFGFGIIRFFPVSDDKAGLLNSSFTFTMLTTVVISLIFLAGISWWSPELEFVREYPVFLVAFVIFSVAATMHSIAQQTFVASRRTGFAVAQGTIFSLFRLILAVVFAYFWGKFGIFSSQGLAYAISLGICLIIFIPRILPGYRPLPSIKIQAGSSLIRFSFANYIGEGLWTLPSWLLPIIILNLLGAESNAYYYIAWSMSSLLLAICMGLSFSLFAEGSNQTESVGNNLKSSLKLIILVLIPVAAVMAVFGDKLLLLFGREYSIEGTQLLRLFVVATLPASLNILYISVARVEKNLKGLIAVNGTIAIATLVLSYIAIPGIGIFGVGISWLATQIAVAVFTGIKLIQRMKQRIY